MNDDNCVDEAGIEEFLPDVTDAELEELECCCYWCQHAPVEVEVLTDLDLQQIVGGR